MHPKCMISWAGSKWENSEIKIDEKKDQLLKKRNNFCV